MGFLLQKSKENINSAVLLIENKHHSSSVHCSYFSCIQLMLHVLRSDFNKTEEEIAQESFDGSRNLHGFHNWIQNTFFTEVGKREKDGRIVLDFSSKLGNLKGIRIRSDYGINQIGEKEASKALEGAKSINQIIEKRFKI